MVQFLQFEDCWRLQFEAAWSLTNIISGTAENTATVINHGAVPIFVKLLESKSNDIKEQAIWALGNIAGDSPECRNIVFSHDALTNLLPLFHTNTSSQSQLSNFCRGKPSPKWQYVQLSLKAVIIMIKSEDQEILQDICWALRFVHSTDYDAFNT